MVWLFAFGEYSFQRPKNMHPFACISKYCGFSSAGFFHVINCCRFFFHSIFATSRCSWICLCKSSPVLIYEMRSTITKSACFILFFSVGFVCCLFNLSVLCNFPHQPWKKALCVCIFDWNDGVFQSFLWQIQIMLKREYVERCNDFSKTKPLTSCMAIYDKYSKNLTRSR